MKIMLGSIKTRKGTKKDSKQGVVLVTVLFILAIALIFIMSALMLTTATRTRLYTRAEDNQARLTVTAAAESFYQALYMQEITDTQLQGLDGASLRMVNDDFPGMSAGDSKNMTWAYFDVDGTTVIIDFKTTIGDQTECIKMVLSYNDPGTPANAFNHLVNVSRGGNMNRLSIGMTTASAAPGKSGGSTPADSSSNTLVFRDTATLSTSNQGNNYFYSTVFVTGPFFNRNSNFYRDLIFWGSSASLDLTGVNEVPIDLRNGADVYFIDNERSFQTISGGNPVSISAFPSLTLIRDENGGNGSNVVFDNTNITQTSNVYLNSSQNLTNVSLQSTGTTFATGSATSEAIADTGIVSSYRSQNALGSIIDASTGLDLLSWEGTAAANLNLDKSATEIAGFTLLGNGDIDSDLNPDPGYYRLHGTMGDENGKDMPVVTCDVSSGNYYFFIDANFNLRSGIFKITGGGPSSGDVFFIICTGKQFNIGTGNMDHLGGIVCTNCYTKTPAAGQELATYHSYANISSTSTPHAYIYAMGGSPNASTQNGATMNFNGNCQFIVLNAYVGLYPAEGGGSDDGTIWLHDGNAVVYGRFSCAGVYVDGGNSLNIPYCPKPGEEGLSNTPVEKYSDYLIYDYQYYTEVAAPATPAPEEATT